MESIRTFTRQYVKLITGNNYFITHLLILGRFFLSLPEEEAVEEVEDDGRKEELELEATTRHLAEALDHGTTPDAVSLPPGRCRHGYAWNKITHQCEGR